MVMKHPGLAFQAESIWSMGCSHLSNDLLCRAGRRHLLLHGEGFLLRAWDMSKPSLHGLEKVGHPREDVEKGGLQRHKEVLVIEREAKEINELPLANGSEKSLKIYI